MSAAVCGKRSSVFGDLHASPPLAKRIRLGSSSPNRFQSLRIGSAVEAGLQLVGLSISLTYQDHLNQLRALFPEMEDGIIERLFASCGQDLDLAIQSLNDLRLSTSEGGSRFCEEADQKSATFAPAMSEPENHAGSVANEAVAVGCTPSRPSTLIPVDGQQWIQLVVNEMMSSSDIDDAKFRARRFLDAFEKALRASSSGIVEHLQNENAVVKEQVEGLSRDNHILKRAVTILHERESKHEECSRELQGAKQVLAQHREQIRTLELNNYALQLHLRQAQAGSSIPGKFHPDLF